MSGSAERMRAWQGPAVLGHGFRPFFLGAALWAVLAMALWLGMLTGRAMPPSHLGPVDWHAHALIYGYLPAVLAGFLLTAIPNWTGRLPVVGWRLAGLWLVWLAGRVALTVSATAPGLAAAVDLSFLALLGLVAGREVVAGRNWRNLVVLAAVAVLWLGNLVFHLEAMQGGAAQGLGARIGIAAGVFLIVLVGGRIVPSFTRNWLVAHGGGRLPAPFGRVDQAALGLGVAALGLWAAAPASAATAVACAAAGVALLVRLARWAGWRTAGEPLVLVLHVGYLFAALGFLAVAAPGFGASAALHVWTVGAIGVMTLAVMTRASLGHTGRPLAAEPAVAAIYAAIVLATLARMLGGLGGAPAAALHAAAALWLLAFGGFAVAYWPVLTRPRVAQRSPSRPAPA